ncbi:MAG: hypothetical protein PHS18_03315 [Sphaerochaetaceae bacterium]|nr:hypothetical protein [Sphaerochaetaceae bacterium]
MKNGNLGAPSSIMVAKISQDFSEHGMVSGSSTSFKCLRHLLGPCY